MSPVRVNAAWPLETLPVAAPAVVVGRFPVVPVAALGPVAAVAPVEPVGWNAEVGSTTGVGSSLLHALSECER